MVGKILSLENDELGRLAPFFGLYVLLFAALTLADGLSLALFVQQVGAAQLPMFYGLTALANVVLIGAYLCCADRVSSPRMFAAIILGMSLLFFTCWVALRWFDGGAAWRGLLFIGRETAYTLILLHFGTYLQDYFSRQELVRVLPVVYAGGRLGGIAGGWLLDRLSGWLPIYDLLLVMSALGLAALAVSVVTALRRERFDLPDDLLSDRGLAPPRSGNHSDIETAACHSVRGFVRFVRVSPLMFWITVTSFVFMLCRWMLNFQYNRFFELHFTDDVTMAQFLGRYTQVALTLSLVIQLVLLSRLVQWLGIKGVHLLYGVLLCGGLLLNLQPLTLAGAVYSRLVESELRFALRNPAAQLMTNLFSKRLRTRARSWTFGVLTPAATFSASMLLVALQRIGAAGAVGWVGALAAVVYLLTSLGLFRSFHEDSSRQPRPVPFAIRGLRVRQGSVFHKSADPRRERVTPGRRDA